ncbi:tubulin--tyrosine ligase isoform X2 [Nematostella vectensis]|uniref:tubulin--tyrosine ligase isoform X2 n=2 Tax=Nematostella vectensis TaxID=45351 RepID=UPI0020778247|nr:tubulin--tyrosine ligase isoform X2 [Nematostella vectensis]
MYKFVNRDDGSSIYRAVSEILLSREEWRRVGNNSERFNLMFGDRNKLPYSRLGHSGMVQAVNYYRGSAQLLCRKVPLVSTVRSLSAASDLDPYRWMPKTFIILPQKSHQAPCETKKQKTSLYKDEREEFLTAHKWLKASGEEIWIAKSSAGAKGEDICLSSSPKEILDFIDEQNQAFVVQKYIENPLLLEGGRKFDIRCWVLLSHKYSIHVFNQGVLRTSSEVYDVTSLGKLTSHLTNHCIQEANSDDFGKYEKGNEMFFDEFSRYLEDKFEKDFEKTILQQMHAIVKECLLSVEEEINTEALSYHSFQLFGFDFMVDATFKVWLLEINGAPASAQALLSSIAQGIVNKAIDPIFPPPDKSPLIFQDVCAVHCRDDACAMQDILTGVFIEI